MENQNNIAYVLADQNAPGQIKKELLRMLMLLEKKDRDELLVPYLKKDA